MNRLAPQRTVPVTVNVTLGDYPGLARLAEHRGFDTIGEFLENLLRRLSLAGPGIDEVELLVRAGLNDAQISTELNLMLETVRARRRRLGLPANRRYRKASR